MSIGQKLLPVKCNTDLAAEYFNADYARFIKNLTSYVAATNRYDGIKEGQNVNKLKALQSNEVYANIDTDETYRSIGTYASKQTNEVFVLVYSDKADHFIYRLNCNDRTVDIVYRNADLNFQPTSENFIHEGAAWLEVLYTTNPDTEQKIRRTFFMFTDGFNPQRELCVEDSIATNGFDPIQFPYFAGTYDKNMLINMGIPTPNQCVTVEEIPATADDLLKNNTLLFNTWKFRISITDPWGRPSEYSIISDIYIPGINDCIANSNNLPRCLNLKINGSTPLWDKVQIAWLRSNETVWHEETVLNLYNGSPLGEWWLRQRNPDVDFDKDTNTITYQFCRDKECIPISINNTERNYNPLPKLSQGLAKIGDSIALYNNTDGFFPFSNELKSKIQLVIEPPAKVSIETRNITVYVPIWNEGLKNYQQVFQNGTSGYLWGDNNNRHHGARQYSQYFTNNEQSGFIGYLVNGNVGISSQVYLNGAGELVDDPTHNGLSLSPSHFTMQKWEFTGVPPGKYIFRLASHLADPTTQANYTSTSTTVWGLCPFDSANIRPNPASRPYNSQELFIDVCDADYSTLNDDKILVILDNAYWVPDVLGTNEGKSTCGYIYETEKNGVNEFPVELMKVSGVGGTYTSIITDHNGFYYFSTRAVNRTFSFTFMNKCILTHFDIDGSRQGGMQFINKYLDEINADTSGYSDVLCNRALVKGRVLLDSGIGVPNAVVILARSQPATTDNDGFFTLIAHDDINVSPRRDILILSNGACTYRPVEGGCLPERNVIIYRCISCEERDVTVSDYVVLFNTDRSLLSDETYGVAVQGFDFLDRATYAEDLPYIHIPSIIESQTIGASKLKVVIAPEATFPAEIKYITFSITAGITIEDYLDWIVDSFLFVDNTGIENTTAPTQIKIYYRSLNEYNLQNNFNTTTNWQFISSVDNQPVLSDKVQFLINGDGTFFTKSIVSLIKYDKNGLYFLIDYTSDLKDLQQNALIRLIRPKDCINELQPYYEICSKVDIVNGKATVNEFYLNAFDTYYLSRKIPVPVSVNPNDTVKTSTTTKTTNNPDGTVTTVSETTNETVSTFDEPRIFGFNFEHHSPSDFWGLRTWNNGRIFTKNPYETQLLHQTEIALSGSLSSTGLLNYLNYFDNAKKFSFKINNAGGIVCVIYQLGFIKVILEYDNFMAGFNDNLLRVVNGVIQLPSAENLFGNPERKIGNNYGCKLQDKNTIRTRNNFIMWVDRTRGEIVQDNYSDILSLSNDEQRLPNGVKVGKCDAWFRAKLKSIQRGEGNRYFVGTIDPITNCYLLTDFSIDTKTYINSERTYNALVSETVAFDIATRDLKGWFSFLPEYYAFIDGDILNNQLFAFKNGVPYSHYNVNNNSSYNNFFGVQCERVFRPIYVQDPFKKTRPLWLEVYGNSYFADQILNDSNQKSRLLLAAFDQRDYLYAAPFMCDLNSVLDPNLSLETGANVIMDGTPLFGSYTDIRLIGNPDEDNKATEILGIICHVYGQAPTSNDAG